MAEMRTELDRPCGGCPFRRESLASWLGPWDCDTLLHAIGQGDFACHRTLGDDAERALAEGRAQSCAGAALFLNATMTLSRGAVLWAHQRRLRDAPDTVRESVLASRAAFRAHHTRATLAEQAKEMRAARATG